MNSAEEIWKKDFPVRQSDEHKASRREFARFLGCALLAGASFSAVRSLVSAKSSSPAVPFAVATVDEISIGGSKLFRHPMENAPCILIRLDANRYAAYSQSCTHLMCPVHFNAAQKQLVCPCHNGFFSAEDGRVLAGPPPRPLPRYAVEIRKGQIWITSIAETDRREVAMK